MTNIPPSIELVRDKKAPIPGEYANPDPWEDLFFPPEYGTRFVFLDQRFEYPEGPVGDAQEERSRVGKVWSLLGQAGAHQYIDLEVKRGVSPTLLREAQEAAQQDLGRSDTAEYYEKVFGRILELDMDIAGLSTGITSINLQTYHDIFFVPRVP